MRGDNATTGYLIIGALMGTLLAAPAAAGPADEGRYDIDAQDLGSALRAVAAQAGLELIARSDLLRGRRAAALAGQMGVREVLDRLLEGSGLTADIKDGAILVRRAPSSQAGDGASDDQAIVVTGSRIKGAPLASPLIVQSQRDLIDAGQTNLGDALRALPQNFGGSQNPGVGLNVPENSGTRLGAGSSLNLRGLGGDATLTLLNGHRLSYNSFKQAIDVSAIPLAAVDRIEIVADGGSAIYGSDAVAGVANIRLKRDFDGFNASARFGAATDGGDKQQQYGLVAGQSWSSGGAMLAYDYEHDTAILARQRDYAAAVAPGLTLYPAMRRHNGVATVHQQLTAGLRFAADAIYNHRNSHYAYALTAAGLPAINGATNFARGEAWAVAPSIALTVGRDWELMLAGVVGGDRTYYGSTTYSNGLPTFPTAGCYCNRSRSVELDGTGTLLSLPGGDAKIALGAGLRSNSFHGFRTLGTPQNIDVQQSSRFAYGELSLPLVGPDNARPLLRRLALTAALRFEDYSGLEAIATPRLGLLYTPVAGLDFKASWGRSFRAPTLYQRYAASSAAIVAAASRGGTGLPATATVLTLTGGSPDLDPERATTWSATLAWQPVVVPEARIEVSWFNIDYRDRIVAPVVLTQALSNPIYADYIVRNPSAAAQAALIAGASAFVNGTGRAYNPADVVALVLNANVNAAAQKVHGLDLLGEYRFDLGGAGSLRMTANASYITSRQRLSALQPSVPLAGRVFNPPHWRARGGLVWSEGRSNASAYLNHSGGLDDARSTSVDRIGGLTTLDLSARHTLGAGSPLAGTTLILSGLNILNAKPPRLRTTLVYEAPYDSTNASPIGRFVSLTVSRTW